MGEKEIIFSVNRYEFFIYETDDDTGKWLKYRVKEIIDILKKEKKLVIMNTMYMPLNKELFTIHCDGALQHLEGEDYTVKALTNRGK